MIRLEPVKLCSQFSHHHHRRLLPSDPVLRSTQKMEMVAPKFLDNLKDGVSGLKDPK